MGLRGSSGHDLGMFPRYSVERRLGLRRRDQHTYSFRELLGTPKAKKAQLPDLSLQIESRMLKKVKRIYNDRLQCGEGRTLFQRYLIQVRPSEGTGVPLYWLNLV